MRPRFHAWRLFAWMHNRRNWEAIPFLNAQILFSTIKFDVYSCSTSTVTVSRHQGQCTSHDLIHVHDLFMAKEINQISNQITIAGESNIFLFHLHGIFHDQQPWYITNVGAVRSPVLMASTPSRRLLPRPQSIKRAQADVDNSIAHCSLY